AADGRDRDPARRPRHRHRRQPEDRGPGEDPRRDPRRRAGGDRDRRPRAGDSGGGPRVAARRPAGDRRQGARDLSDRRQDQASVRRQRGRPRRGRRAGGPGGAMNDRPLWTSTEIAAATGGRAGRTFAADGVSIDSRKITAGDLFVALHGPNFDGNDFVAGALGAGAAGALVDRVPAGIAADMPVVVAKDTLQALHDLGAAGRSRSTARIAAVTGSVGKTSTKEALKAALGAFGLTYASAGNLNNHWGAPLSLARMPRGTEYGVFELGMNHAGEITPLSKLVRPEVAIITTVEAVHIEFFNSVAEIADAKAEIMDGMAAEGAVVLPRDNPHFARLV